MITTTIHGDKISLEDFRDFFQQEAYSEKGLYDPDALKEKISVGHGKLEDATALVTVLLALPLAAMQGLITDYIKELIKRNASNVHSAIIKLSGIAGEITITLNKQTLQEIEILTAEFNGQTISDVQVVKDILQQNVHSACITRKSPSGELITTLNNLTIEDVRKLIREIKGDIADVDLTQIAFQVNNAQS